MKVIAKTELIDENANTVIKKNKEYEVRKETRYGYYLVGIYGIFSKDIFKIK